MLLNDIQKQFKDIMLDHPDVVTNPPATFATLFQTGDIALPERLKVYRNNIVGGLSDTLILTFPLLKKLVGQDFLEGMCRSFILANPPENGCLNTYGRGLDQFIAGFGPAKDLPYLPDVAMFEIAMNEAYFAADDEALQAADLSAIAPEDLNNLVLQLRHSVTLLQSPYPLDSIREFCLADEDEEQGTLDLDQGGAALMVYRPGIEVRVIKLAPDEFMLLKALRDGAHLGAAVEDVLGAYEDFDFQDFLQKHLDFETFQALSTNV